MGQLLNKVKTMPLVKVLRGGQITLPKKVRDILSVNEGDVLELEWEKNKVVLKPKVLIDKIPESESELSLKGKEKIKEAIMEYERGKTKEFSNVNDLIKDLRS